MQPFVVVGAAILDRGRVLAARRAYPADLAGLWELPGGKVEPGEDEESALVRECREELGITVRLGRRVGGDWPIGARRVLRVWLATIASGVPENREHGELRWLGISELYDVEWLPADLPIVAALTEVLRRA